VDPPLESLEGVLAPLLSLNHYEVKKKGVDETDSTLLIRIVIVSTNS
jgi:hypothetical protein